MNWTAIMTQQPAETPQGRRRERIAARLRETLAALEADPGAPVTVAALTRRAGSAATPCTPIIGPFSKSCAPFR
jgi:DNA-binding GntR family transcriptional regulator